MTEYRLPNNNYNKSYIENYYDDVFCLGQHTKDMSRAEYTAQCAVDMMVYDQINYYIKKKLDKDEAEIVIQVYFEGKTKDAVAKNMDMHITTIYRKLISARQKLMEYMLDIKRKKKKYEKKDL